MLTIIACPKPFSDPHIGRIQRNAIRSWLSLGSGIDVLLAGDEEGTEEAAAEFGVRKIRDIRSNEYGTPLLSDIFRKAEAATGNSFLCYINADILAFPSLLDALRAVSRRKPRFMMGGRPWNVNVSEDLTTRAGFDSLRDEAVRVGNLRSRFACDWFCWSKGLLRDIPDFVVGRCYFDNALLFLSRRRGAALVDATHSATTVHQNHPYPPGLGGANYASNPEALRNLELAGGVSRLFDWTCAQYRLGTDGLEFQLAGYLRGHAPIKDRLYVVRDSLRSIGKSLAPTTGDRP